MLDKGTDFPQYRKLLNNKVFYKIIDDRHFDEVQIIGKKAQFTQFEAKQYPEILRIQDMLQFSLPGYVASSEQEFQALNDQFKFIL